MKKAFTITELLVAIGLLAAVLAASTMVFHYSIEAQRTAMATAEIMRTMRAITDQLDTDFAGLRAADAPMIIEFHGNPNDANNNDSIVFFANGNFQDSNGVVYGNVARIYYGQSKSPDPNSTNIDVRRSKILARKQVILEPNQTVVTNEYEPNSLSQQVDKYLVIDPNTISNSDVAKWIARPDVNSANPASIPMYLAKGVDNFSIMYCPIDSKIKADGTINWYRFVNQKRYFGFSPNPNPTYAYFKQYPALIKFTFTLYDSKKILKGGRRFEHIVYTGQ